MHYGKVLIYVQSNAPVRAPVCEVYFRNPRFELLAHYAFLCPIQTCIDYKTFVSISVNRCHTFSYLTQMM